MIAPIPTSSELLSIWERGTVERPGRRALTLLAAADPGIPESELAFLPVGCRDAALLDLRERLFGDHFTGVTCCPSCGEDIELSFDVSEARRDVAARHEATLQIDGIQVELHLPNGADLADIDAAGDVADAREMLFTRCVAAVTAGGESVAPAALSPRIMEGIVARLAELDPQADVTFEVDCPSCAHGWREPFDIAAYLWIELVVWARRLLIEVHRLASAYGWSESEILRLPSGRRNAYLEMLS